MGNDQAESRLAERVRALRPKEKQPASARILDTWIAQAQSQLGNEVDGGRLGWLIASSVAIAAVQRALDAEGRRLFLLKGGTGLQPCTPTIIGAMTMREQPPRHTFSCRWTTPLRNSTHGLSRSIRLQVEGRGGVNTFTSCQGFDIVGGHDDTPMLRTSNSWPQRDTGLQR